jgi:hypothetical protein
LTGARIHTDEYDIYAHLAARGHAHRTVCDGRGEYARDEDDNGFCEVHVNTLEGIWSLATLLVVPAPPYLAGKAAAVSRLFSVRAQCRAPG